MISDKVSRIYINTGNLTTCKSFNRRAIQSPSEEVLDALKHTLVAALKNVNREHIKDLNGSTFINSACAIKVDKDDRVNVKLTVKIFLTTFSAETLNDAITEAMRHLDVTLIDSLIVALPNLPSSEDLDWEPIKPLWSTLEGHVHTGKVITIGISDLDTEQLMELYNWSQVKPSVNQVNVDTCCAMPEDMTKFAKENDVQLLTHNDPNIFDLLPKDAFENAFESIVSTPSSWKNDWIVRYSVIVKCRGIVQNKGYLLCATQDPI